MTEITNFIEPALLILVPVLYILGMIIKQSESISDRRIPLLLGLVGVILAVAWVLATSSIMTWQNALLAVFTAFVQGVLCAGAAVYANQIKKQAGDDK